MQDVRFAVRGVPTYLPASAAYVSVNTMRHALNPKHLAPYSYSITSTSILICCSMPCTVLSASAA
jgi:hypothetical protein